MRDDSHWMMLAQRASEQSKDQSRKTGAVIVDSLNAMVAIGWNGFPRRVRDLPPRHERPAKYLWTEHAERNAIYIAARQGVPTAGCRMYVTWYPCADCARAIIQAGVCELIGVEPDWNDPKWAADFAVVRDMLAEAGVACRFLDGYVAPKMKGCC